MNGIILGKKLKEARLARKMTQSDVVGGYITRNMLSQIESGAAFPSIRTLEYLSGVLEVPMSELVTQTNTENAEPAAQSVLDELIRGKEAYKNGDFEQAVNILSAYLEESNPIYDESAAIIYHARTELIKKYEEDGDAEAVNREKKAAASLEGKGVYL
ncbi:MAG: helix-turn-helix domain-containing protein [Oscillospiraceae bacterium]|nr:helix-turn-helix domain-containing protein [Oscillospiraceae bacterium]